MKRNTKILTASLLIAITLFSFGCAPKSLEEKTTTPTTSIVETTPTLPVNTPTIDKNVAPTTPAPTKKPTSKNLIKEFEGKYNITLDDETKYLTGTKLENTMAILESALKEFSTPVIKKIVKEFEKDGREFKIYIMKASKSQIKNIIVAYAISKPERLGIELYIPEKNYPGGVDKPTIVHEFGHFVHYALERDIGRQAFKKRFTAFNNGEKYDQMYTYDDEYMFATNYGSEDYYEDVATVFEMLGANYKKVKKLGQKRYKPLLEKAKFLEKYSTDYFNVKLPLFNR